MRAKQYIPFNLNYYIKVELYDKGYQLLADLHNMYIGHIPNLEKRDAEYYKQRADKDGYTKFQAWDFFADFGGVTGLGYNGYYNLTILIENNEYNKSKRFKIRQLCRYAKRCFTNR